MKKKVFYLELTDEVSAQLTKIAETFPCFIWEERAASFGIEEWAEIAIEAREEDWPAIEKILAPVV